MTLSTVMGSIDYREIKKAAERQGWQVRQTKKGHWQFIPPDEDQDIVIAPGTPSDWRSIHNFLADMKRSGLVWPEPRRDKKRS